MIELSFWSKLNSKVFYWVVIFHDRECYHFYINQLGVENGN